jgi:predicted membrane channel-forming protein YqfA (hemolysin III family)
VANADPGGGVVSNFIYALAEASVEVFVVAVVALVVGGVLYLSYLRGRGLPFLRALFHWAVVVAAAGAALLVYVE